MPGAVGSQDRTVVGAAVDEALSKALRQDRLVDPMMSRWPFADPPNLAVLTVRQVLHGGEPVLYVVHDADDGGWQFLTGEPPDAADALLVSLRSMIAYDPSLAQLADLPVGWSAQRDDVGSDWRRAPRENVQ